MVQTWKSELRSLAVGILRHHYTTKPKKSPILTQLCQYTRSVYKIESQIHFNFLNAVMKDFRKILDHHGMARSQTLITSGLDEIETFLNLRF